MQRLFMQFRHSEFSFTVKLCLSKEVRSCSRGVWLRSGFNARRSKYSSFLRSSKVIFLNNPPSPLIIIILDANSEKGVRSKFCYLICLRHLIRSRSLPNQIFFHAPATFTISTMPHPGKCKKMRFSIQVLN